MTWTSWMTKVFFKVNYSLHNPISTQSFYAVQDISLPGRLKYLWGILS